MTSQQLADVTWDKNAPPATMSRRELEGINIAMLTLTSLVFIARIAIRLSKRRTFELQDFFCCLSYLFYVAMLVMFFKENDPLYRAERVQRGEAPLYPGLRAYNHLSIRIQSRMLTVLSSRCRNGLSMADSWSIVVLLVSDGSKAIAVSPIPTSIEQSLAKV